MPMNMQTIIFNMLIGHKKALYYKAAAPSQYDTDDTILSPLARAGGTCLNHRSKTAG